ncbi:hypothetical protein TNCV_4096131 [Trichonephila clavipes]|nr:hypothetical protein TNCV_4096131 [Trichonephila clavipes]
MGTLISRTVGPSGAEYGETMRSNYCSKGRAYPIRRSIYLFFLLDRQSCVTIVLADEARSPKEELPCLLRFDWPKPIVAEGGRGKGLGRSKNKRPTWHISIQPCHGSLVVMAGMSRAQAKYPPCRGTMHIKSVEFKRPPIGVVVRRGEFQLRCRP